MSKERIRVRKQKWNGQEDQYLKFLRDDKKIKSWKIISREMVAKFPDNSKTPKQCRENYRNYARFYQDSNPPNVNSPWTHEQDKLLERLYTEMGSSWSRFTNSIPNKSQNCIKNRFYNLLKKLSKNLDSHRMEHKQSIRGASCYDSMIRILEFSGQIKNLQDISQNLQNMKGILFDAREQILKCCFHQAQQNSILCNQYCSLIRVIKDVNKRIKCFGICKAKNRKLWKLPKANFTNDQPQIKLEQVKIQAQSEQEDAEQDNNQAVQKTDRSIVLNKLKQEPCQQLSTFSDQNGLQNNFFVFPGSNQMIPLGMPYFPFPMFQKYAQNLWENTMKTEAPESSQLSKPLVIVKNQES